MARRQPKFNVRLSSSSDFGSVHPSTCAPHFFLSLITDPWLRGLLFLCNISEAGTFICSAIRHCERFGVQEKYLGPHFLKGRFLVHVFSSPVFKIGLFRIGMWLTDLPTTSNSTTLRSAGFNRRRSAGSIGGNALVVKLLTVMCYTFRC